MMGASVIPRRLQISAGRGGNLIVLSKHGIMMDAGMIPRSLKFSSQGSEEYSASDIRGAYSLLTTSK
jgi:hypothetical protein